MRLKATWATALVFIAISLALIAVSGVMAIDKRRLELPVKGPGVTRVGMLSEYFKGLAGTAADTQVYYLEGKEPGGTLMVVSTTHGIEPAGLMTTTLLAENAVLERGRLILIPHVDRSNLTWNEPGQGHPENFQIKTPFGYRTFPFGARYTNPVHQWPDPEVYVHYPSGQMLSGEETRNLNRAYPGRPDGSLTQKVAYAICELLRREKVDVAVDLHEAPPEKPLINAITAHDRAMTVAGLASMNLEMVGVKMRLEISPKALRGLSHREWGDHTQTMAFLLETANPAQGGIREVTDAKLVVEGKDGFYYRAAKLGRLYVPWDKNGHPIEERCGMELATIDAITAAFAELTPDRGITITGMPSFQDVIKNGVGQYLRPVE